MQRQFIIVILLLFSINISAQDTIATQILDRVNTARMDAGIATLYFNTALQSAAQQHSNDMASVEQLSHIGTDGSQFWERIQSNNYILSTGAENILSRGDTNPESTFRQWYNSEPHRANMLNSDYFEVGIAYAIAESGRVYFTLVFGARVDFVAPTAIPTNTPIPTNTSIPATAIATATHPPAPTTAPTIQVTNTVVAIQASSTPGQVILTNTAMPTARETIQPDIQLIYDRESFLLINVSGSVLNLANLFFEGDNGTMSAFRWNTEFLSQPLSGFTNGDCLQVWTLDVSYLDAPESCRYRHAWIAVAEDAVFWRDSGLFTVRNGDNLVGVCRVADGICEVNLSTSVEDNTMIDPIIFGGLPDLRLEYPDSSFTLINVSGHTLDLTELVFRSESGELSIHEWNNGFLTQAISDFSDGGCLQAWTFDYPEQSAPGRCRIRHAWILVGDSDDFWRQADNFTIERDGVILGRCSNNETQCTVYLSTSSP